ncbi:helix-turn-helix domain-containing protein [Streptomyces sp. NPDC006386]|uniref:ArsR/SmtB family transcription factor n=1 Tax=Streptomyces sp. NPDC006386 TaxID=3156762 RepID=UPI0033B368F2
MREVLRPDGRAVGGPGVRRADHLVEETGARQTNLSNHLRVLREAGVVETEPCGRYTYYRLRPDVIAQLAEQLGDLAESARAAADNKRACP